MAPTVPTRSHYCFQCNKATGPASIPRLPTMMCSRCSQATYCSAECQRAHWPKHKSACKEHQKVNAQREETSFTNPQRGAMKAEAEAYIQSLTFELCHLTMRNAWRLGRPDACNETHMLALFADYDPAPDNIRKRFTLTGAEARNFDWYLDFAPDAAGRQELRASLPTKDNARVKMIERQEKAYVGALTLHSTNIKTKEQHMQLVPRMMVKKEFFPFAPIETLTLNTKWQRVLIGSSKQLAAPPIEALLLQDLFVSEGEKRAMTLMDKLVTGKNRVQNGVDWKILVERGVAHMTAYGQTGKYAPMARR